MAHEKSTLVGRDSELDEIASRLGVHRPGTASSSTSRPLPGGAVLLSGDAGVGKTRLLAALRDLAQADGWQVSEGHCLDFGDSAMPYLPFTEVVGRLAADRPDVVAEVARTHPALARLAPGRRILAEAAGDGLGERIGERAGAVTAPSVDRAEVMEAVHALLEALAASGPLLLVVEDVHWADQSTRELLSFLFTRPFGGPVSVVTSYRSDDLHRRHPLRRQVAEWLRLNGVDRLALAPLDEDAVRRLIHELVPGGVGEDEESAIVARAEGNAFFVEELTSAAAGPDSWVPADLADVLLVRLDRLDDTARQVVRTASASGRSVSHDMLAAVSGLAGAALDDGLRQAVETNVLVADAGSDQGSYAFRHALLGEAVYDDLLPGERVRLHAEYAAALGEGRGRGTAAELARHALLAMDRETALSANIRAGDEAATVGGPDEAADHYERALELLADPHRPVDPDLDVSRLAAKAAGALALSGRPARAADLLREQLLRLPADAPATWRARLLAARAESVLVIEWGDDDPLAMAQEALDLLPDDARALRAGVLNVKARVLAGIGRLEEAQAVGMDALGLAERLGLTEQASEAVTTLSGLKKVGPKEALRSALVEAVDNAVDAGATHAELRARFLLGRSYEDWGELDEAEAWFRSGMAAGATAAVPWAPYGFECRWQLTWIMMVRGQWDEVLSLTAPELRPPPVAAALLGSLRLLVEQARGADTDQVVARARDLRRFWETEGAVGIHSAAVEIGGASRRHDVAGAVEVYRETVAVLGRIWQEWFGARIRLAALTLGAVAEAVPHLSSAEREGLPALVDSLHADGHDVVLAQNADPSGYWGPEGRAWVVRLDAETLRVRWLLGVDVAPRDVLLEAWREAERVFDEFGDVHEAARVRLVLATILRATGDPVGSRGRADLARASATALGARPLLDDLVLLGSTPTPTRGPAGAPATSLTAREREILALVAEGRSNGEVAGQLFISTKTVSVHVSNILAKLGAAGRTEAAAIARRDGLLG